MENKERDRIKQNIEQHGCHLIMVMEDNDLPAFVHTIGLYEKYGHPELIVFGLKKEVASEILNDAAEMISEGQSFTAGQSSDEFLKEHSMQFLSVDKRYYEFYFGYASRYFGHDDFPVLQMVWPDKESLFPWQEGFVKDLKFKQPLLDRNTDFMFFEERNAATFVTKKVLEGAPILCVYHDDVDGDWQFFDSKNLNDKDLKLVSLEQITKLDPSVNKVHFLPYGATAWRKSPEDKWEF
jgi:hypothetical protein